MSSAHLALSVITTLGIFHSSIAIGQQIDIKGLHLGMTKSEVTEKYGPMPIKGFTVAGVSSKYPALGLALTFHEDKLDTLTFFFNPSGFNDVRGAVTGKYPSLHCEDSAVSNAMGGSFTQTICSLKDDLGAFRLQKFVSDIKTSALILMSDRKSIEERDKKAQKQKDDI